MNLFPDQLADLAALRAAFKEATSVLFTAPTGYGKTVLFSYITARNARSNRRVTILAHRAELVDQISRALAAFSVPHGIIAPGYPKSAHPVQVASVFTLRNRLHRYPAPDLLVVDEAHHAVAGSTWSKITGAYSGAKILGVTATPVRLDGTGLSALFTRLVLGPTTEHLIALGRLSPLSVYAPPAIDTAGLRTRMGDFVRDELIARVDKPKIVGDAVSHYRKLAANKRAVVFCVSVEHAKHVAHEFMAAGFTAVSIDGTTDKSVRKGIINDFQTGLIRVLCSCDLISEGFDCPGIEVGISLRPTQSQGLWRQQVGRCLRTAPGKDKALILDHAANSIRLGVPGLTPDPEWSLSGTHKATDKDRAVGIRVCPQCFAACKSGTTTCSACGHVIAVNSRRVGTHDGTLEELTAEQLTARFQEQRRRADTYDALVALGQQRGMKNPKGWADHVMHARKAKQSRRVAV